MNDMNMNSQSTCFNEYISIIIQTDGIEFVVANYLLLREDYYSQQNTTQKA